MRTYLTRSLSPALVSGMLLALPLTAQAASATFFGPIVPPECNCPGAAPAFGCVLATIQNVINFGISIGIIAATLALAYAGFVWMTGGSNPEARNKGRTMLLNVFIGLVILLTAWLVVDFIMKKLYVGEDGSKDFGPWNSILAAKEGDQCIVARNPSRIPGFLGGVATGILGGGSNQLEPVTPSTGGGSCTAIPDSQLTTVDGYRLTINTAERYKAMKAAAAKDGITLVITSGYRSPDDQLKAWNDNGCSLVNNRAVCTKRTAAVPCSLGGNGSNHTRGTAVDIRLNPGVYTWLTQNAAKFGFYNKLSNDLPHWSDTGR